ncbi:MAG: S24/S26 family peptidase [Oscillospiraceae bacterium]|nr:S24/S26 family peptidase [Oscillospiraceae bacterium]
MGKNIRPIPMEELFKVISLQLENGGRAQLTVTGRSMLPLLRAYRDSVELIPVSGRQKNGRIILYRRANGQFVLHRIVRQTEDGYICCGDNEAAREPVMHTQLLAVVDVLVRKGKRITLEQTGYQLYTALWVGLFPLRGLYIAIRRFCGKCYRSLRKKEKKL